MLSPEPSIRNFINEIENGKIVIPSIQRAFDWRNDEERITKFYDSIIKKYPIGMFLLYQKPVWSEVQIFGRKLIDRIDEYTKFEEYDIEVEKGNILVLDGQQRLQSLYIGVTDGSFYGKHLYHDVFYFKKERSISDISFKFFKKDTKVIYDEKEESLYIRFADIIKLVDRISGLSPNNREQGKKILLKELRELIGSIKQFSDNDYNYIYEYLRSDISNSLFFKGDSHILHYELITEKEFDENILEMFIRFNQGGLRLGTSDLIFSNIKLLWKDAGKNFEDLAKDTGISKDLLLKSLMVVSGLSASTDILKVKGNIELLKNNYGEFKRVVEQFDDAAKKLTDQYDRIYDKFNFMIPVLFYFYKSKKLDNAGDLSLYPKVLKYLLIIVYNSRLSSDNKLDKIIRMINDEKTDNFPLENIEKYLNEDGTKTSIDEMSLVSDPRFTFSLIQRNNWKPLYKNNKLHVDHIFPEGRIEELPEELRPLVNSIFNKYVVFAGDNIRKSDTMPDQYFIGEKERLIDSYILPKEYLKKEDFKKMIEWRKQEIKKLFKNILGIDICDGTAPDTNIQIDIKPQNVSSTLQTTIPTSIKKISPTDVPNPVSTSIIAIGPTSVQSLVSISSSISSISDSTSVISHPSIIPESEVLHAGDEDDINRYIRDGDEDDINRYIRDGDKGILRRVFRGEIPLLLNHHGPLKTIEIYDHLRLIYPELCNDEIMCTCKKGAHEPEWKHQERFAQFDLKSKGVTELINGRWHLK